MSVERLTTQFEITTSTDATGNGTSSITPLRKIALRTPASAAFACASASISSVMSKPEREARLADAPSGEDHVDAAARAEVEHRLALLRLGDRGRVAAAERGQRSRLGDLAALVHVVEALAAASVAAALVTHCPRGRRSGATSSRSSSAVVVISSTHSLQVGDRRQASRRRRA